MMHGNFISPTQHNILLLHSNGKFPFSSRSTRIGKVRKVLFGKNDSWIWISKSNQQNIYGLTFFTPLQYFVVASMTQRWASVFYFLISRKRAEQYPHSKTLGYLFPSDILIFMIKFMFFFSTKCFYSFFVMKRRQ